MWSAEFPFGWFWKKINISYFYVYHWITIGLVFTNLPNGNSVVNIEIVNMYFFPQNWPKRNSVHQKSAELPFGWQHSREKETEPQLFKMHKNWLFVQTIVDLPQDIPYTEWKYAPITIKRKTLLQISKNIQNAETLSKYFKIFITINCDIRTSGLFSYTFAHFFGLFEVLLAT